MNGFINFYKPSGESSAKAISKIKKKFKGEKIGHMGTLDPMASGVLPVAIGKATRLFDFLLDKTKIYRAEFTFGYPSVPASRCVSRAVLSAKQKWKRWPTMSRRISLPTTTRR